MDFSLFLKAVLLGIVEGLTEFLPISSTGHLILASDWLEFNRADAKTFEVVIQLGAILSVCWHFRQRLAGVVQGLGRDDESLRFVQNLLLAFLPAAVLGGLLHGFIKHVLFSPLVVAIALIVGGVVILIVERYAPAPRVTDIARITPGLALKIGFAQTLALVPGVSRSGATIMGGMACGLSRQAATEFSFFLAIPVMFAATAYDLAKNWQHLAEDSAGVFAVGFIAAFLSALAAIRFLLRFVSTHDFRPFAWYRIVFGLIVLAHLTM
ncbi:MAG: undecaprenyl-diphosphate phosphatase [Gammaproteobacteria bacterium]|nr:undecaprenyl-diphosphate phosphatase [Gammaproteobacteria bacterium]